MLCALPAQETWILGIVKINYSTLQLLDTNITRHCYCNHDNFGNIRLQVNQTLMHLCEQANIHCACFNRRNCVLCLKMAWKINMNALDNNENKKTLLYWSYVFVLKKILHVRSYRIVLCAICLIVCIKNYCFKLKKNPVPQFQMKNC